MLGVDGCKQGWVGVRLRNGRFHSASIAASLIELDGYAEAVAIAVDMPLGLPTKGVRLADQAARKALPGRASTIFNTPVRQAVFAESYEEANRLQRAATGRGLSKQSWNLCPKIRELDALADERLHEVHPEVVFRAMHGSVLTLPKKSWGGLRRRLDLLLAVGIEVPADVGPAGAAASDDVVDAAACAYTALHIAGGSAAYIPADGPSDSALARRVAIWHPPFMEPA